MNELVDQIESIDVSSNQIIIITTRQGPPDMARVAEWTSLFGHDWEDPFYPFIKNFGIGVSLENGAGHIRLCSDLGKYTINWLQPNHWYGVYFRAEQRYGGGTAIYANEEFYLLKTKKAEGINGEGGKPIISFKSSRNQENGHSLENLILTIKWEQLKEERQNLDALANITLFCNNQINYRQLKLNGKEENKSLEIYYGKTSPFVYEESHRFLVNTGSTNEPLIWQFNLTNEKEIKPNVIATAILLFKNYELGVDIEPLCKADDKVNKFTINT
uniref:Uncharacterized protein n=1 Tax=Meloidogyne javanica TaxID=6303 RepID=A0A915MYL3_MELJA